MRRYFRILLEYCHFMVLNYIWIGFFLLAFLFALGETIFNGNIDIWTKIMNSSFDSAKTAFELSLGLTGVLSLWMGIMKIGERGGMIPFFGRLVSPLFSRLFPGIPKGHPAMGAIFMNVSANMLGLDNAATPLGLKAMQHMQELNTKKDTATDAMLMFLVLNASGLILIPIGIMTYRASCLVHLEFRWHPRSLPEAAHQHLRQGNPLVARRDNGGDSGNRMVLLDTFGRQDAAIQLFFRKLPAAFGNHRIYSGRNAEENQSLRQFHRRC